MHGWSSVSFTHHLRPEVPCQCFGKEGHRLFGTAVTKVGGDDSDRRAGAAFEGWQPQRTGQRFRNPAGQRLDGPRVSDTAPPVTSGVVASLVAVLLADRLRDQTVLWQTVVHGARVYDDGPTAADEVADGLSEAVRAAAEGAVAGLADVEDEIDEIGALSGIGGSVGTDWSAEPGGAAVRDREDLQGRVLQRVGEFRCRRRASGEQTVRGEVREHLVGQRTALTLVEFE